MDVLFEVFSERIGGRRQGGVKVWLARRCDSSLALSIVCVIRYFLTVSDFGFGAIFSDTLISTRRHRHFVGSMPIGYKCSGNPKVDL